MVDALGESNHRFGCSPQEICAAISRHDAERSAVFRISAGDHPPTSLPHNALIVQDLSFPDLNERLHFLVEELLYPYWLHAIPFRFLSLLPFTAYCHTSIDSAAIHTAYAAVEHHLLCRQLCALLSLSPPPPIIASGGPVESLLDTAQCRAVYHIHGPICVLAPAGSGKTRTLVHRIIHMTNSGIPPARIMALAYNTKAGKEMKTRLAAYGLSGVTVRTFHSLGYEICRSAGWYFDPFHAAHHTDKTIYETLRLFGDAHIPEESGQLPLLAHSLSRSKSELILPSMYLSFGKRLVPFQEFFAGYFSLQQKRKELSFDDMVYVAVRLLLDNSSLLDNYQQHFPFILVDEFQDLNAAQRLLVRLLALPRNNLFAVGDDDQMIYGWRGATIRHLTEFTRQHPAAAQIILKTNYRSSSEVVIHSRRLIEHNMERIAKDIQPRTNARRGSFTVETASTLSAQADAAVAWIRELSRNEHLSWRDFAVLFRTNILQFPIALALEAAHIPHAPLRYGLLLQTDFGEIVTMLVRVLPLQRGEDTPDLPLLLKRFRISRKRLDQIFCWRTLEESSSWNGLPEWEQKRLHRARTGLFRLRTMAALPDTPTCLVLHEAAELFANQRGQTTAHRRMEPDGPDDRQVFEIFLTLAQQCPLFSEFSRMLVHWNTRDDSERFTAGEHNEVALSTIHRTKGNEYRNVVYYNMTAIPNGAISDTVEEERRVVYVALTRAQDHLLITAPKGTLSHFLAEAALNPVFSRSSSIALRFRWLVSLLGLPFGSAQAGCGEQRAAIVRELTLRKKVR